MTITNVQSRIAEEKNRLGLTAVLPDPSKFKAVEGSDNNLEFAKQLQRLSEKIHIDGLTDKKGYDKAKKFVKLSIEVEKSLDAWKKVAKEESLKYNAGIDKYYKSIASYLVDAKKTVKEKMKVIDDEESRLQEEERQRIEERYTVRYGKLIKIGMSYNGLKRGFELEAAFIHEDMVRESDGETLKELVNEVVMPTVRRLREEAARKQSSDAVHEPVREARMLKLLSSGWVRHDSPAGSGAMLEGEFVSYASLNLYSLEKFKELVSRGQETLAEEQPMVSTEPEELDDLSESDLPASLPTLSDGEYDKELLKSAVTKLESIMLSQPRTATGKHAFGKEIEPKLKYLAQWFASAIKDIP